MRLQRQRVPRRMRARQAPPIQLSGPGGRLPTRVQYAKYAKLQVPPRTRDQLRHAWSLLTGG
eukprot:1893666-Prymnesium_polylepis.1